MLLHMDNHFLGQEIIQVRKKMNISQTQLATMLGISVRTLESWVRHPSSSAKALIRLLIKSPHFVLKNLA
ncbi:helix-turn-helix domain-containing protein [Acinetobacter soli]